MDETSLLTIQPLALQQRRTPARLTGALSSLVIGGLLWWWLVRAQGQDVHTLHDDLPHWVGLAVAIVLCLIAPIRNRLGRAIEQLRNASPRAIRIMTVAVFVLVPAYLMLTAFRQYRDLFPKWHDQQMLLVQAQMLARGRLWMPQHPCADFFETFYIFVKPCYAPIYFPGGAMLFVPTVWLHLPFWLEPLLMSGALAAMLFRIMAELIDAAAGLLAAVSLTSLWVFRLLSLWEMSHTVLLLLVLWAIWSWMRWRHRRRLVWLASIGIALGWAAITRPLDAVAYAIPLGIALLWDLRREQWRRRCTTIAILLLTAAPFLTIQLIFDKKLTGRWLETPFQHYYFDVEFTGLSPSGGMPSPDARATSTLPQKQLFGRLFVLPTARQFASQSAGRRLIWRAGRVGAVALPSGLLLLLLPAGLLAMRDVRRMVLFAPVVLFTIGYTFYPFWLDHYCLVVAPGVILCALLGAGMLADAIPRRRQPVSTFLTLAILSLLVTSLPEFHPGDEGADDSSWPALTFNYEVLPEQVNQPALVLYRYWKLGPGDVRNFNDEPVYNVDVAWPDDAPIVRAHDLGSRDAQIIEYYARRQPDRSVYIVDRIDLEGGIHSLGTAGELARRLSAGEDVPGAVPHP